MTAAAHPVPDADACRSFIKSAVLPHGQRNLLELAGRLASLDLADGTPLVTAFHQEVVGRLDQALAHPPELRELERLTSTTPEAARQLFATSLQQYRAEIAALEPARFLAQEFVAHIDRTFTLRAEQMRHVSRTFLLPETRSEVLANYVNKFLLIANDLRLEAQDIADIVRCERYQEALRSVAARVARDDADEVPYADRALLRDTCCICLPEEFAEALRQTGHLMQAPQILAHTRADADTGSPFGEFFAYLCAGMTEPEFQAMFAATPASLMHSRQATQFSMADIPDAEGLVDLLRDLFAVGNQAALQAVVTQLRANQLHVPMEEVIAECDTRDRASAAHMDALIELVEGDPLADELHPIQRLAPLAGRTTAWPADVEAAWRASPNLSAVVEQLLGTDMPAASCTQLLEVLEGLRHCGPETLALADTVAGPLRPGECANNPATALRNVQHFAAILRAVNLDSPDPAQSHAAMHSALAAMVGDAVVANTASHELRTRAVADAIQPEVVIAITRRLNEDARSRGEAAVLPDFPDFLPYAHLGVEFVNADFVRQIGQAIQAARELPTAYAASTELFTAPLSLALRRRHPEADALYQARLHDLMLAVEAAAASDSVLLAQAQRAKTEAEDLDRQVAQAVAAWAHTTPCPGSLRDVVLAVMTPPAPTAATSGVDAATDRKRPPPSPAADSEPERPRARQRLSDTDGASPQPPSSSTGSATP